MNLLNQQEVKIKPEVITADAVVHLVQPVCLPANHSKLVKVKFEGKYSDCLSQLKKTSLDRD